MLALTQVVFQYFLAVLLPFCRVPAAEYAYERLSLGA
jgi:hypothetical protein